MCLKLKETNVHTHTREAKKAVKFGVEFYSFLSYNDIVISPGESSSLWPVF